MKMWGWIAREIKENDTLDISELKETWLDANGYRDENIARACFFCDYAIKRKGCKKSCPALKINWKNWIEEGCCDEKWHYENKPLKFYAKLQALNRKRLAKKKRSKK